MDTAALAQAQAALKRSQYQLAHGDIRAPFPGRVVARLINTGEYATAGKPMVRLVDVGSLEVSVQAPIDSARYLARERCRSRWRSKASPCRRRCAPSCRSAISPAARSRCGLTLPAGDPGWSAMPPRCFIPSAQPHNVLAVPRDALVLREDNTYVFKVDKKARPSASRWRQVRSRGPGRDPGLQLGPGERVIVRGAERLEQGRRCARSGFPDRRLVEFGPSIAGLIAGSLPKPPLRHDNSQIFLFFDKSIYC